MPLHFFHPKKERSFSICELIIWGIEGYHVLFLEKIAQAREWSLANCSLIPGPEALGQPGARIIFFSSALLFREGLLAFFPLITNHRGSFHLGKEKKKDRQEAGGKNGSGIPTRAHIFTRFRIRAVKGGRRSSSSMFKVRKLPVRFGTKQLDGDRSRQQIEPLKPQRLPPSERSRPRSHLNLSDRRKKRQLCGICV